MLGHYLLTLTAEQEDRVLTKRMRPGDYSVSEKFGPCLVGTVLNFHRGDVVESQVMACLVWARNGESRCVEVQYDDLCDRFGLERVNAALRTRILANRAHRLLGAAQPREEVTV